MVLVYFAACVMAVSYYRLRGSEAFGICLGLAVVFAAAVLSFAAIWELPR